MRNLLIIFTALILSSCGTVYEDENHRNVDPALEYYVKSFEEDSGVMVTYTVDIVDILGDGDQSFNTIGLCIENTETTERLFHRKRVKNTKTVQIQRSWWESRGSGSYLGEEERMLLIYHELGHCSLGLEHDETVVITNNGTCFASAMSSQMPSMLCINTLGIDTYLQTITPYRVPREL